MPCQRAVTVTGQYASTVPVDAPFFHDSAHAQMADILAKATRIFAAAGSSLDQVVRALHFHADLAQFRSGSWLGTKSRRDLIYEARPRKRALIAN